jgi:hypothetical protein
MFGKTTFALGYTWYFTYQLAAGKRVLVLTGNGSRFFEEFSERPYRQAIK